MQTPKRDEPSKPAQPAPKQGAPASYAAHADRKNLSVRVLVRPVNGESDEVPEHGYGHGV
jgi:hypothetical protein